MVLLCGTLAGCSFGAPHDFYDEIVQCVENPDVNKIVEGIIVKHSGYYFLRKKAEYKNTQENDSFRDKKVDIAFSPENGVKPKLRSQALFCFGEDGIISRHYP